MLQRIMACVAWLSCIGWLVDGIATAACPEFPVDPSRTAIVDSLIHIQKSMIGVVEWRDEGGGTPLELRRSVKIGEDQIRMSAAGRGPTATYLFVAAAGADDSPAIAAGFADGRDLTCFAARGDTVLLRDGAVVHWVTLLGIDRGAGTVSLLDVWPERFPFLKDTSFGDWNGALVGVGQDARIEIPLADFARLLKAVVAVRDMNFALALAGDPCRCIDSVGAVRGLYDTLLEEIDPKSLAVAGDLAALMPHTGEAGNLAMQYEQAVVFLAGTLGMHVDDAATDAFVAYLQQTTYNAFAKLSPAISLVMYERLEEEDSPLARYVRAPMTHHFLDKKLTPLERFRYSFHDALILERTNHADYAVDELKFTVHQLEDEYEGSLAKIKALPPMGWRSGVAQADAYDMFRLLMESRASLVRFYAKLGNRRMVAYHLTKIAAREEPFPMGLLANAAAEACDALSQPDGAARLRSLDLNRDAKAVKTDVLKYACADFSG